VRSNARRGNRSSKLEPPDLADTNARVAALLQDMAVVQTSQHSRWGYQRAAAAILALEEPLEALVQGDGVLRKIANVGPSSTRVIFEVLREGRSPTVDQAVAGSSRARDVERSRSLRENFLSRAAALGILRNTDFAGPRLEDYRGDLQMHSVWSDGVETLENLILTALARGYLFSAVTDHSFGLPVARGMSMSAVAQQHREIDDLNRRYEGRFRLLKGIEANIGPEGNLDLSPDDLRQFELVVAAPHSQLRLTTDQTARIEAAISIPGVHILGHPRGRMSGARAGVVADWDRVFRVAARRRVAIEIDGDPHRQDVDFALARHALAAGCLFALDSDAHSPAEFWYAETAIAHASLAGIPPARIVNCWDLEQLLKWSR